MDWLKNWDDLVHGTAVFSAAAPVFLVLALAIVVPARWWWLLLAVAVVPAAYWLFGIPVLPPQSSDDIFAGGLLAAVAILAAELGLARVKCCRWPLNLGRGLRAAVFFAIAWSAYPAWLATGDYAKFKPLVCAGFGISIALISLAAGWATGRGIGRRFSISPAALIPPTIALAVLLQTGGSMRFAQLAGAMAAGLAGICLMLILRERSVGGGEDRGQVGALWGMLFVLLGWSGWLFAEIRYGFACLLLLAPLAAALVSLVPFLPRKHPFLCLLWDFLAAALVAFPVAVLAAIKYAEEMAEFEGY